MGRRRGKSKKQTVVTPQHDVGNVKEEKIRASKSRGRPQKPFKDEVVDEEIEKIANGDDNGKSSLENKSSKCQIIAENGAKRKRYSQVNENSDVVKDDNGAESKCIADNCVRSVGFRQNGSRRKSKPRRAAEVGVECKVD